MADPVAERLLDIAIELAEAGSWEAVRLHRVAEAAGLTLDELRAHFREKEDMTDLWFDRADRAMLQAAQAPDFAALGTRERLQRLIMTWLGALAAHRRVTRQMILNKLEPGHLHVQIPGLLRVSRTVQWMREAARREATYVHRAFEETGLTSIYLATFVHWMYDGSPGSAATDRWLASLLQGAGRLSHAVFGHRARSPETSGPAV
jgi:AcrR family transcriptional regulator